MFKLYIYFHHETGKFESDSRKMSFWNNVSCCTTYLRACIFIEAVTASMHNPGKGVRSRFTVNAFFMLKLKIAFFSSQNLLTYSRQD